MAIWQSLLQKMITSAAAWRCHGTAARRTKESITSISTMETITINLRFWQRIRLNFESKSSYTQRQEVTTTESRQAAYIY